MLYLGRLGPYSQILDKCAKKPARISDEEKNSFVTLTPGRHQPVQSSTKALKHFGRIVQALAVVS